MPNIMLQSTNGEKINLSKIDAKICTLLLPHDRSSSMFLYQKVGMKYPGARGCTHSKVAPLRDHYSDLQKLNTEVFGLSTQDTGYQKEMVERLHLPFPILSDIGY